MGKRAYTQRKFTISNSIILILATGIVLTSPAGTTGLVRNIIRELGREPHVDRTQNEEEARVRASLYRLKRKGYIKEKITKEGTALVVTPKGREMFELRALPGVIKKPHSWDGFWRFVMFDVPEENKSERDILRDKLKRLDFFQVQKSVWVHPYPCIEEIMVLTEFLNMQQYVLIFEGSINRPQKLKGFFQKKGYKLI